MADPSTRPHNMDLVDEILAGTISREEAKRILHTADPKGLTPIGYAALSAARDAHSLLALTALLDPPKAEEQSQMDLVLDLLERLTLSQVRAEQTQAENRAFLKAMRAEMRQLQTSVDQVNDRLASLAQCGHRPSSTTRPVAPTSTPPGSASASAGKASTSPPGQAAAVRRSVN